MMMMYFHGGYNEVILFDFWRISTLGGLIGSMIGCFLLGILYEGIKFFREFLINQSMRCSSKVLRFHRFLKNLLLDHLITPVLLLLLLKSLMMNMKIQALCLMKSLLLKMKTKEKTIQSEITEIKYVLLNLTCMSMSMSQIQFFTGSNNEN